ncbi:hypothetical protein HPB49_015205 [Dermacentor silvarum]|uniref:Uncharacterized protein n=1 Tax=Dermacentor silvarum TaxID=543639 RepID=A0ACB8CRY5_DERSI|nr:hypothetical protein HPB49_015205 [Dermacentor silvarum]
MEAPYREASRKASLVAVPRSPLDRLELQRQDAVWMIVDQPRSSQMATTLAEATAWPAVPVTDTVWSDTVCIQYGLASTGYTAPKVALLCSQVEVVADKCARKHYSSYKLEHSKTQPLVKKCFSNRAHVTDLMLDCAEPMAGKATHDPDFKKRTKAFKTCVEKGLQGTVPAETDPYEFDKRRKKKIRRRLADPSGEGLFNNVFPRYANDSIFLLCRLHDTDSIWKICAKSSLVTIGASATWLTQLEPEA